MRNIDLAQQLIKNACDRNEWCFPWEGIRPLIEVELLADKIQPTALAVPQSTRRVADIVQTWEVNTEQNYHSEMRKQKMKKYKDQKVVYTIQTAEGDQGFIQWIDEDCIEHDEVGGHTTEINPDYFHIYRVISEEEYLIIKCLHALWEETENQEYWDMINKMIDLTFEKNAKNLF